MYDLLFYGVLFVDSDLIGIAYAYQRLCCVCQSTRESFNHLFLISFPIQILF